MRAGKTVYVVDDDEAMAASMEALMFAHGLRVEVYASAELFLRDFDPSRAGCLVLDVRLPGMSGLDLKEVLQSQGIKIPIIFISGHADEEQQNRAKNNNAVEFLEKPFSGRELCDRVHAVIAQRRCG